MATLRVIYKPFLGGLLVVVQLLLRGLTCSPVVDEDDDQFGDVDADYALGVGDNSHAIGLQANLVRKHPENSLAL